MRKIIEFLKRLFCKPKPNTMKETLLNAGSFFSMTTLQSFVKNFKTHVKDKKSSAEIFDEDEILDAEGKTDYRRAELFGKNFLMELLENKGDKEVVALRFYYALAPEDADGKIKDGGKLKPRLFIVPVDEKGKDIRFNKTGMKDEPSGDGGGNGISCPRLCN